MGKRGNGVEHQEGGQTALDLEEESSKEAKKTATVEQEAITAEQEAHTTEPDAPMAEPEATMTEPEASTTEQETPTTEPEAPTEEQDAAESVPTVNAITELGNTNDACWKVLADGERVEISDKEWRKELTLMLAPSTTQTS